MNNYYNSRGLPDCHKEYQRKTRISNVKMDKLMKSQIVKNSQPHEIIEIS